MLPDPTDAMTATTLLLISGILDALGAGILIYDVLINLIQPHLTGTRFKRGSNQAQAAQLGSMWLGVAIMAVIGLWA
jgi:zinc transporter 1/2/3